MRNSCETFITVTQTVPIVWYPSHCEGIININLLPLARFKRSQNNVDFPSFDLPHKEVSKKNLRLPPKNILARRSLMHPSSVWPRSTSETPCPPLPHRYYFHDPDPSFPLF